MKVFNTNNREDLLLLLEVLKECKNENNIYVVGIKCEIKENNFISISISSENISIEIENNSNTFNTIMNFFSDSKFMKIGYEIEPILNFFNEKGYIINNVIDLKNILLLTNVKIENCSFDFLSEKFFNYCSEIDGNESYKNLFIFKYLLNPSIIFMKDRISKKGIIPRNSKQTFNK